MQRINHTDTFRKNLLVGLAVGTGAVASGCGAPEPASLENANRGEIDYSKLDYSQLDYSKLDGEQIQQFGEELCDPANVSGKDLGNEMVVRLDGAIKVAIDKKLDKAIVDLLVSERKAVVAGNQLFADIGHQLGW